MRYIGLMSMPPDEGFWRMPEDEQAARDLAHQIFGTSRSWPDTCFSEVHYGDPLWMFVLSWFRPRLTKVGVSKIYVT